ncbi:MAG: HAD hydrolase-like protein [Chloroflexota bacterium]|nr:HAD hydrolase-like protein [Chloroflexota bacterium]
MKDLLVFDLDGVITSEEAYWDAAGLTVHELLYSPRYWHLGTGTPAEDMQYHPAPSAQESRHTSRAVFPEQALLTLKARAINSNWDTSYIWACLYLINLLAHLPDRAELLPLRPWDSDWITAFRRHLSQGEQHNTQSLEPDLRVLDTPPFHGAVGLDLINRCDDYASEVLDHPITGVFSRHSPFWTFCQDIFQQWYLGDDLYTQTYQRASGQPGKPGCIYFEQPLLPIERIRATLEALRQQGYTLGIATGRVRQEALVPLKRYDLLSFFDEQHISTYDYVEQAEAELRAQGKQLLLSKPHPFPFLLAFDRARYGSQPDSLYPEPISSTPYPFQPACIVIGDSTSDIIGGRAAGALTVAVFTGARTPEARSGLAQSNPDFTIDDVTTLPALLADIDSLQTIQRLQFSEREKAERLLQRWFARHMDLTTERVILTPRAVSLNSFNGVYRAGSEDYFFKTHVEEQGVLAEYYHAELLHNAGYNIVKPLRTLHTGGQQMVIYPLVDWPVMFDLLRDIETESADHVSLDLLVAAEQRECARLLEIYQATQTRSTAQEHAEAPIHQLFWHRLTGGRLDSFYQGKSIPFPEGQNSICFDDLLHYRWLINGVAQQYTLGQLIEQAKTALNPARAALTSIGHGDAHFGNVFLERRQNYLYFDPAFAGRHTPLLDIIKPLFHNVFATWMYFPQEIARTLQLTITTHDETLSIEHNYLLTPVRQAILQAKVQSLLTPMIAWLRAQNALPADWLLVMQAALLCCPLLTVNLSDGARMPPAISWLGLAQAVQVGNSGIKPWRTDL